MARTGQSALLGPGPLTMASSCDAAQESSHGPFSERGRRTPVLAPPTRPLACAHMPAFSSRLATARAWVDPEALPVYLDAADISGNVPHHIKQLVLNTLGAYGVGSSDCFAHTVGRHIRIAEMNCQKKGEKTEVVVVAEVQACKGVSLTICALSEYLLTRFVL